MRYLLLICCCSSLVFGGTDTKPKVEDYEVHGRAGNLGVGAEFTVHSFGRGEQMFIAQDYLVVEVALFPPKATNFEVHDGDFALRINGGKELLAASDVNLVIEDMQHPEFKPQTLPHAEVGGGVNGVGVTLGGPPMNRPFPGSTIPAPQPPPRVDIPKDDPSGVKTGPVDPYQLLKETALEEGQHHAPASGFLYFHFRGNVKSIKTLELVYQDTALKLR